MLDRNVIFKAPRSIEEHLRQEEQALRENLKELEAKRGEKLLEILREEEERKMFEGDEREPYKERCLPKKGVDKYSNGKNKKRAERRIQKARYKKRMMSNAETAKKSFKKRREEDKNNRLHHSSELIKSGVAKIMILCKKTSKIS